MTSLSSVADEPEVVKIECDGCGEVYEELSAIAWGRMNGLLRLILCIECDPMADLAPRLLPVVMVDVSE